MERDFEQEFRELKQSEIPDLWNRIEAGLSEKKNVTPMSQSIAAQDKGYIADGGNVERIVSDRKMTKKRFAWRRWGALAAACLCVAVMLPAFSLLIRNKSYSGGNMADSAAKDSSAEFAVTEEAAAAEEPAAAAPADGAADYDIKAEGAENMSDQADAGAADSSETASEAEISMNNDASQAGSADTAAAADESGASAEKNDAVTETAKTEETGRADVSNEEKAAGDALPDGQMLENVAIQIQKAEDGGTLYQALVVQADADGFLKSGTQIALMCDEDTAYDFPAGPREEKVLKENAAYQADLRYDKKEERFVVLTVENTEE